MHARRRRVRHAALKEDLEKLIGLLSHKLPRRELREVVREAVRCAIEKHGKRKGAVEPARRRQASMEKPTRREPTAELRRQVWKRDGGRCAWVGQDGKYRRRRGEREATSPGGGAAAGVAPEGQPRDPELFPPGAPS